ncbi:MAG: hypothetical protein LBL82_01770 [Oscillospiraceae bacterium]|jgi:hypothetical protein|nr:hypothetical protein [Oscillospiraceae bacterium]
MTNYEFTQLLLSKPTDERITASEENDVKEIATLISGNLVYRLYENLIKQDYEMNSLTEYIEMLSDSKNAFGIVYLFYMLSDAVCVTLPEQFADFAGKVPYVPYLAAALVDDWLDFHADYEA